MSTIYDRIFSKVNNNITKNITPDALSNTQNTEPVSFSSERADRMKYYNDAINATTADQPTSPSTFKDVNTNIDLSGLNNINTDLSGTRSRLDNISNTVTDTSMNKNQMEVLNGVTQSKNDIVNFNSNITPDMLAQQRGLRSQSQLDMEKRLNQGLDSLQDYSSGNSQVDRTIANATLGRFDASSAAANLSQAQKIASNPYLSEGAKNVASAELARTTASQRAQLSGQLAQQSQERAFTAADKYANLTLQASQYEEGKFKDDMANINQSLDRNLSQLKMVGDLSVEEAGMAMDKWKTEISTKLADAARSLDAAVAIGELDQAQANIEMNKAKTMIDAQVQKAQLELEKLRGIQDNDMIDAQIQNLENQNIGIWSEREANAIIDWKTANQRDDGTYSITDDVNAIKDDPAAIAAITQSYQALTKNPNAIPTDEYILAKIKAIPTPTEASMQSINNKLFQMEKMLVGDGPNQISPELWPKVKSDLTMLALTEGSYKLKDDGTVSVLGADGSEMGNIGGYTSDSLKANYGDAFHEVNMNAVYNGMSESDFVKRLVDPNSELFQSNFTDNKVPLSKSEATSLYRSMKTEIDNRIPADKSTDTEWQNNWTKVQDDMRFDDLGESATATAFKESGATNFDDFSKWLKDNEKFGNVVSTQKISNGKLVNDFGKEININEYPTLLKNANDPNSPNYKTYQDLLKSATTKAGKIGGIVSGNRIEDRPPNGTLVNVGNRLLYVKNQGRSGKGGVNADTITYVDIATGKEQTFAGTVQDRNAGMTINNLYNWTTGLGV